MAKIWGKKKWLTYDDAMAILLKSDPSASLTTEGNQALTCLIQELGESLNQGLEELDSVQSEIATLVEVAKETSSLIRSRISILSRVSSSRETNLASLLQQCSSLPAPRPLEDRSPLAAGLQFAGAEGQLIEPPLWLQDQG